MRYVVSYDVTETKRRTRLRKNLLRFGNAVQFSVFECDLTPRELARMKKTIGLIIDKRTDNVRIYPMCEKCAGFADVYGGKPLEKNEICYVI
ncbi:MAG TPA: CRISPR-associated endonuclease Cas2 [Pyrinomonadaceae bacterium]|jgi:CRISPR-associated protein Cas2